MQAVGDRGAFNFGGNERGPCVCDAANRRVQREEVRQSGAVCRGAVDDADRTGVAADRHAALTVSLDCSGTTATAERASPSGRLAALLSFLGL